MATRPPNSSRPTAHLGGDDASERLAAMMRGEDSSETRPADVGHPAGPASRPAKVAALDETPVAPLSSAAVLASAPRSDRDTEPPSFGVGYAESTSPALQTSVEPYRPRAAPPPEDIRQTLTPPLLILGLLLLATSLACFSLSDDRTLGALPTYIPVLLGLLGLCLITSGSLLAVISNKPRA